MRLFAGKKTAPPPKTQLRSAQSHPFGVFDGYVPLGSGEDRLYRAIREAVPVVDAAVMKIIRLTGGRRESHHGICSNCQPTLAPPCCTWHHAQIGQGGTVCD